MTTPPQLILTSASPAPKLLRQAGYQFTVHPADFDEEDYFGKMLPIELAAFLAKAKANEVAPQFEDALILAADTVVAFGDESPVPPPMKSKPSKCSTSSVEQPTSSLPASH